jgi:histidinol-phosphatase
MATHADDLSVALRLADAADEITSARFRADDLVVRRKPDRTPVTDADTAVEDAIRSVLASVRPDDAVLGEERGGTLGAGRTWVVDPIDGTKNFLRGVPAWATLIALVVDVTPVVAAVSAPALGRRWWASAGAGAFGSAGGASAGGASAGAARRLRVSEVGSLADAYVSTTDLNTWGPDRDRYLALVSACWESRAFGDFWQHCLVAEGALDLAVEPVANAWDLAAVQLLVTEAGGAFTDLSGTPGFDHGSALVSNGLLHEAAMSVLREA